MPAALWQQGLSCLAGRHPSLKSEADVASLLNAKVLILHSTSDGAAACSQWLLKPGTVHLTHALQGFARLDWN